MYNLFIYHHPRSWFVSEDDHSLREIIENKNGIILTGHEHTEDAHIKKLKSNALFYSVGGSFDNDDSTFKVISINNNNEITELTYVWSKNTNLFILEEQEHDTLDLTSKNLPTETTEYLEFLDDIGMLITHPRKKVPLLSDLYVDPFLSITTNKNQEIKIKDEDTINTLTDDSICIIDGDYGSGKTSLAKKLIKNLINKNGFIVVYIDVSRNQKSFNSESRFKNYFEMLLRDQYGKDFIQLFPSISNDKKVIVIDNYHLLFEKESSLGMLHSFIDKNFKKVYLFTNNNAGISGNLKFDKYLMNFSRYNIENFGSKLQSKIVEKWNKLDNIEDSDEELQRKNRESAAVIKTLFDGNSLPKTPDSILTILSTSQTKRTEKTSLYGYLLTHIISNAMERANIDGDSHVEIFRILCIFAYSLYKNETRVLDFKELKEIVEDDNKIYGLENNAEKILNQLEKANLFKKENINRNRSNISDVECKIAFRYNYLYSYFVARYFSEKLTNQEVVDEIERLLDTINLEDNSRIIINIWYFSNEEILLQKLEQKIVKTMNSYIAFDFRNPPKFIKEISKNKQQIIMNLKGIDDKDVEKNKLDLLEREEIIAHEKSINTKSYNENKISEQTEIVELNTVVNLISTIGQIIKCYGGSIKAEQKVYLIKRCYELGMKSLTFIFDMLEQQEDFIDFVNDIHSDAPELNFEDAYEKAFKYVSFVIQVAAFSTICRISDALSSEKLALPLKEYLNLNSSIGLKLVDITVNYLFLNNEKSAAVEEVINDTKNNFLATSVLRTIIWRYYYYNPAKSKPDKNKLLSKLNIKNTNKLILNTNK